MLQLGNYADNAFALAWSPDGEYLASAGSHVVRLWEAKTGRLIQRYEGYESGLKGLAWSPDGTALAWWSEGNAIEIWDMSFLVE